MNEESAINFVGKTLAEKVLKLTRSDYYIDRGIDLDCACKPIIESKPDQENLIPEFPIDFHLRLKNPNWNSELNALTQQDLKIRSQINKFGSESLNKKQLSAGESSKDLEFSPVNNRLSFSFTQLAPPSKKSISSYAASSPQLNLLADKDAKVGNPFLDSEVENQELQKIEESVEMKKKSLELIMQQISKETDLQDKALAEKENARRRLVAEREESARIREEAILRRLALDQQEKAQLEQELLLKNQIDLNRKEAELLRRERDSNFHDSKAYEEELFRRSFPPYKAGFQKEAENGFSGGSFPRSFDIQNHQEETFQKKMKNFSNFELFSSRKDFAGTQRTTQSDSNPKNEAIDLIKTQLKQQKENFDQLSEKYISLLQQKKSKPSGSPLSAELIKQLESKIEGLERRITLSKTQPPVAYVQAQNVNQTHDEAYSCEYEVSHPHPSLNQPLAVANASPTALANISAQIVKPIFESNGINPINFGQNFQTFGASRSHLSSPALSSAFSVQTTESEHLYPSFRNANAESFPRFSAETLNRSTSESIRSYRSSAKQAPDTQIIVEYPTEAVPLQKANTYATFHTLKRESEGEYSNIYTRPSGKVFLKESNPQSNHPNFQNENHSNQIRRPTFAGSENAGQVRSFSVPPSNSALTIVTRIGEPKLVSTYIDRSAPAQPRPEVSKQSPAFSGAEQKGAAAGAGGLKAAELASAGYNPFFSSESLPA